MSLLRTPISQPLSSINLANNPNNLLLEWYYQNERLLYSWTTFKIYFKSWQGQQTNETVRWKIYSAKQSKAERGIAFVNHMQGAFAKLEDSSLQAKQIRIITS